MLFAIFADEVCLCGNLFSCGVMVAPLILVQKIVVRVHAGKLNHPPVLVSRFTDYKLLRL